MVKLPRHTVQLTENIADAIIKYAPKCKQGKLALYEHIAKKLEIKVVSVEHYIQTIRALQGLTTPSKSHEFLFPILQKLYSTNKSFKQKIDRAIEANKNVKILKEITYPTFLYEVKLMLEEYKEKKPPLSLNEWVTENLAKRINPEVLRHLAASKKIEVNELVSKAISDAEKTNL